MGFGLPTLFNSPRLDFSWFDETETEDPFSNIFKLESEEPVLDWTEIFAGLRNIPSRRKSTPQDTFRGHDHDGHQHQIKLGELPVEGGRITSHFGRRHHPISGEQRHHNGIDIAARIGAPIRSSISGEVIYSGPARGFGPHTVILRSDKQPNGKYLYFIYGHNSASHVQKGQRVKRGDLLARVGNEGRSTGPHAHIEERWSFNKLDGTGAFTATSVDPLASLRLRGHTA